MACNTNESFPLNFTLPDQFADNSEISQDNSCNTSQFQSTSPSSGDCVLLLFEEFIPWDNPDNIISKEVETLVRKLLELLFLPVLFLISCPANIINMVVFYKHGLGERINVCLFALSLSDELYMINNMLWFGEQLHIQFTTREAYGPVFRFLANHNLLGFYGFLWISQILTAIIASERCFCILQPLRSKVVLRTSTMTAIIIAVNVLTLGLFFLVATRVRVMCAFDLFSESIIFAPMPSEFFYRNEQFILFLDVYVFGAGLPVLVMAVVTTTTVITIVKLRQAVAWRTGTSSSSSSGVSQREVSMTKMLVANSIFFLICVFPFVISRIIFIFLPEVGNGRRHHNFYATIQWILVTMSCFNSTFNIVVYYTMGSRFRDTFWQIFRRKNKSTLTKS